MFGDSIEVRINLPMTCLLLVLLSVPLFAEGETIRVGIYHNPPKIFINEHGEPDGFFVDLMGAIAKKENWTIKYVIGSWEDGLARVESGDIDILVDVAFTPERAQLFAFNEEVVLVSWAEIYSNNEVEIQSFTDLDNRRVATMKDSIITVGNDGIFEMVKSFDLNVTFLLAEDYQEVFEMVKDGSADAGAVNNFFGYVNYQDKGLKKTLITFQPSQLKFAFPKNNTATPYLIERIDADLKAMKADQDSAYYAAMKKHLTGYVGIIQEIPLWAYVFFLSLIIIIVVITASALVYRRQKQKLEYTNRMKDLFIDIIRHDLLNPAGVIRSESQSALSSEKNPKNRKKLERVYQVSNKLIVRIKEASLFSKLEDGTEKLAFSPIDIGEVVQNTIDEASPLAEEKRIRLVSNIKGKNFANLSILIYEVIFNLLSNAIKYSPEKTQVTVDLHRHGAFFRLSVADEGPGVPNEYKKAIFQRFIRLDKSGIQGTGLGLAIAKKIVDFHGGRIWVEDNKKKGSIFFVELPLPEK